ncbi:MAG: cache domain-containing protein [Chloroflexi bacterium]|nr:cache domain-containing protein [Chloroflexota bacterium]
MTNSKRGLRIPIATKLILSFLLIIVITSTVFTVVGIQLISNRIVTEAQEKVGRDLNSAREIYLSKLNHLNDVVRLIADRFYIKDALISGDIGSFAEELVRVKLNESLDLLTITDPSGNVLLRANNINLSGDSQYHNELVAEAINRNVPVAGTMIMPIEDLRLESQLLVEQAHFTFIDTPMARVRNETEETSGMMLGAAAPIFDYQNNLIGILYGGILLNRNYEIVDEIKRTVFQDLQYKGQDIGTATIFQDDLRISTNVKNGDGSRAIGTRVSEEVYNQVVVDGKPYIGRAYVVNSWYITAYEPIKSINHQIIGILYVGILEQKYVDIKQQTVLAFLSIALIGVLVSTVLSYLLSRSISGPIKKLVLASKEVANGNLDTKVEITTTDELGKLAYTFNKMALALRERDDKLKEFTRSKIMESERLALIGQLAANVAHELNNPLQGIVTYSHLLLEELPHDDPARDSLEKIVTQANRSRDIIRGLLDFSRQRKPDKTLCDITNVLKGCVSLLEKQALFHNVQITSNLDEKLPLTIIDPSQIERVFINMIVNAADAMDGNGKLNMATRFDSVDHCIEVEFTDTGHGIVKENLEKIFDPFFTTKDTGHGVGLGLAISFGIIKEHNGTISVESEVGKGTTFIVRLPVTAEEESTKDEQSV